MERIKTMVFSYRFVQRLSYGVIGVLGIVLVIMIAACARGNVHEDREAKCAWMNAQEQLWTGEIRMELRQQGFKNAGVALTYVENEEGHRDYVITLHHDRFTQLDETELDHLGRLLIGDGFGEGETYADCDFQVEFLLGE